MEMKYILFFVAISSFWACASACNQSCHTHANCDANPSNCVCDAGYTGDGFSCVASLTPCESDPCHPDATCTVAGSSRICACKSGFIGDGETCVADPCYVDPCHLNATCSLKADNVTHQCNCTGDLIGDGVNSCIVNPCDSDPCHISAICSLQADGLTHQCNCTGDLIGDGVNDCKVDPLDGVMIDCSDTSMSITILNEAYDNVTFALQNTSCIFTKNGTHNTITIDYDECGTTYTQTNDHIIYSNRAETSKDPNAIITRDPDHYADLVCKLERSINVTSDQLNVTNFDSINITKDDTTSFTINLKLYSTADFSGSPYTNGEYPLKLDVRDDVSVGLILDSSNDDAKLVPQNCYSTPTSSPSDGTKHYIIEDGCGADSTYKEHETTQTSSKFIFKAFKFLTTSDVYIHCEVVICKNSSALPECTPSCSKRKRRNTMDYSNIKEDAVQDETLEKYTLSSQQLILIDENEMDEAKETKKGSSSTSTIMLAGLATGLAIIIIILIALVFAYRTKVASPKNKNEN